MNTEGAQTIRDGKGLDIDLTRHLRIALFLAAAAVGSLQCSGNRRCPCLLCVLDCPAAVYLISTFREADVRHFRLWDAQAVPGNRNGLRNTECLTVIDVVSRKTVWVAVFPFAETGQMPPETVRYGDPQFSACDSGYAGPRPYYFQTCTYECAPTTALQPGKAYRVEAHTTSSVGYPVRARLFVH